MHLDVAEEMLTPPAAPPAQPCPAGDDSPVQCLVLGLYPDFHGESMHLDVKEEMVPPPAPPPALPGHHPVAPKVPKAFPTNPQPRYLEHMGDVELGGRDPDPKVDEHHDDNGEEHSKVTHCGSDLGQETGAERGQETWGHPQCLDWLIPTIPPLQGHAANSPGWMLLPCWRSEDLVWDSRKSLIRGKIQILIQTLTKNTKNKERYHTSG